MDANFEGGDDLGALAGDAAVAPGSGRLAAGAALAGGRYQVVGLLGTTSFGEVYRGTDKGSGHPVAIRLIAQDLCRDPQVESRVKQLVAGLSRLDHKNVARVVDGGAESGLVWLATEYVDGSTLRALLEKKRAAGGAAFSLKGAYNVVAHVCNGLTYAHQLTLHGALCASNVLVNSAGRVKITEFGLSRAFPGFARLAIANPADAAAIAPEMATAPQSADARADVYSVGAVLYELLTGREPSASLVRPSQAQPGLPPEVDQVIARCLAPNPNDRFPDVASLKAALAAVVEARGAAASAAPRVSKPQAAAAAPRTSAQRPQVAAPAPAAAGPTSAPPRVSGSAPVVAVADEGEEKWLVQKDKMDFGPFSFAQVKQQIVADQILPGHIIIDNETGGRCRVEDHPLLHDLVLAAEQKRDDYRRAHAEVKAVKQDRTKGFALYGFIGVGVIGLVIAGIFIIKATREEKHQIRDGEIAELDSAQLEAFTLAMAPQQPKKAGGGKSGGGRKGGSGKSRGTPGFNEALDLGDASEDEESERLDNSQINPVLQRYGGKLGGCLVSTGERSAHIEFIVRGNGKVSDVRVNGKTSGALTGCVWKVMQKMQFPTFNGPRTRAEFDMSL